MGEINDKIEQELRAERDKCRGLEHEMNDKLRDNEEEVRDFDGSSLSDLGFYRLR
jgi:hypothetical protein